VKKKKILIVDSDLLSCRAYQKLFEKKGFKVECCIDGNECLEKANTGYGCILVDTTNLAKLDGWHLVSELKNHDHVKNTPIVIFTSSTGDHYFEKAKEVGADGFVFKFSPQQVFEEVEKVLRGGVTKGNLH